MIVTEALPPVVWFNVAVNGVTVGSKDIHSGPGLKVMLRRSGVHAEPVPADTCHDAAAITNCCPEVREPP